MVLTIYELFQKVGGGYLLPNTERVTTFPK